MSKFGYVHGDEPEMEPVVGPLPTCPIVTAPVDGVLLPTETSVAVVWNSLFGVSLWHVYVWPTGDDQPLTPTEVVSNNTTVEVTGLTPATDYTLLVVGVNDNGESVGCSTRTFSTSQTVIVSMQASTLSASFFAETALVIVVRSGLSGSVTVDYTLTDGSAMGGLDFVAASGTVTFLDGEASKDIVVDLIPANYNAEVEAVGGLYAHWPLNELSGSTAADISGNGRNLSLTSGTIAFGAPRLNIAGGTSATFVAGSALERANTAAILGDVHLAIDGWDRMSAIPSGAAIFYSIGGPSDDSSGNPNWQIMCRAINNGAGGMFPSIFWESGGGGSDHLVNFLTLSIPLNEEFYWKFGRRPSTGEWYCQINNDIAYEAYVTPPDGGATAVITVGNIQDHNVGMLGRMSNVAVYVGAGNIPPASRYDRWKIGATRNLTATLQNPVDCTIADDTTTITLSETG